MTSALIDQVRLLFPYLPEPLVQIYASAWADSGDPALAWATVRAAAEYDTYFPGIRRDDGTLRMTEAEYASTIEAYEDVFTSVGLSADLFRDKYVGLLAGDVSPDELWRDRIQPVFERVLDQSVEIRQYYAEMNGLELTDAAILAGLLDPEMGTAILNREITMAEIGGEATVRGFDISNEYADRMYRQGVTRNQAAELYGEAAEDLPILGVLAKRHADPDDDFDIYEFTNAAIFDDPVQRNRIRRLIAQERQSFTQSVGMGQLHRRDEGGRTTGLALR